MLLKGPPAMIVTSPGAKRISSAITFFEWPQAQPGYPGIGGTHHFALTVADEDGLLKWKRRLIDLGLQVNGPLDRHYFTSLYFRDPDGVILEIATAGVHRDTQDVAGIRVNFEGNTVGWIRVVIVALSVQIYTAGRSGVQLEIVFCAGVGAVRRAGAIGEALSRTS